MAAVETDLRAEVGSLYTQHHLWLFQWLRKKTGCPTQAADLNQDTFVRLLQSSQPPVVGELREPRAYLITIAKRVLSNHWRRRDLEKNYLDALGQLPEGVALSPEEQQILLETLQQIDQRLDGLPLPVKEAFLLSQLDGLPQADIARQLNVSIATVKRYLARATLQCFFAQGMDDDE